MSIFKSITSRKFCELCLNKMETRNYLLNVKYRSLINRNNFHFGFPNRLNFISAKKILSNIWFARGCSTSTISDLISKHEAAIGNFVNNLMEAHRNNTSFMKSSCSSFNSKKNYEISQLIFSRIIICENLKTLEELNSGESKDKELQSLVEDEKKDYERQLKSLDYELFLLLLPEEPQDNINDLVLEIKHGVGGQEAMLFAKDLFEMYCRYIIYKGWTYEVAESASSDIGGLRTSTILVYGKGAFKCLSYEGGVHRVQRIPVTEKGGRIHTSTVAVAILPQPSDVEVVINDKDLKIETKKASGAGGQHVNTTDSAVRITHLPSGTVVECQENKSQIRNRVIAMQRLRAMLYEALINEQISKTKTKRKLQFGTSGRSEKIRTYNFNQDRITDHRIGVSLHNIDLFLEGSELLDKLLKSLQEQSHLERLTEFISDLKVSN